MPAYDNSNASFLKHEILIHDSFYASFNPALWNLETNQESGLQSRSVEREMRTNKCLGHPLTS